MAVLVKLVISDNAQAVVTSLGAPMHLLYLIGQLSASHSVRVCIHGLHNDE